jgi:hypothetical protein
MSCGEAHVDWVMGAEPHAGGTDLRDVRMIQCREHLRLALEPLPD